MLVGANVAFEMAGNAFIRHNIVEITQDNIETSTNSELLELLETDSFSAP